MFNWLSGIFFLLFRINVISMKDIFNKTDTDEILARIGSLQPGSRALWGKMNVAQMLSHAQAGIEVALGDKKLKQALIGILFGRIAKKVMMNEKPFSRNLPTDPSFIRKSEHDFDAEKGKLVTIINRFITAGPGGMIKDPHPFFGKLTPEEWSILTWKHLDHHLRQFGA